jgi:hypothetical protein
LPKGIQTISIPAFSTLTTRYRLGDAVAEQIAREFTARTRFRIVPNPAEADAVLNGAITAVNANPTIFDPTSGKATSVQLVVVLSISLLERATGRVLYSRANYAFRQNYDVAVDPHQYFDESGPAFDRLTRDVARDVVTAVVDNF